MKLLQAVFSVQLCLVLSAAQAFALSGGPVYDSAEEYTGDYSGALIGGEIQGAGSAAESGDDVVFSQTTPSDAIGLFSMGVPQIGLASGPVYVFASGDVYQGDIQAFVDPNGGSITGQINSKYDYTYSFTLNGEVQSVDLTASARGSLDASISDEGSAVSGSINSVRINGSSTLDFSDGFTNNDGSLVITQKIKFQVIGYKQATTQSIAAEITDVTNGDGGGQ